MSRPVTEIAYIPLKPGTDLDSGNAKEAWRASLETISRQEGFRSLRWGVQIEEQEKGKGVAQMCIGTVTSSIMSLR